jgi:hypothetical protein
VNGRPTFAVVFLILGLGIAGTECSAQTERGPVFRFQPGLVAAHFISAPRGSPSATGFNLRFETRLPSGSRWFTPIFGAAVTPYGMSGLGGNNLNAPVLFVGNVFPGITADRTHGWATVDVPVLVYHSYGGGGARNRRLYGQDLFIQLALYLPVGERILKDFGGFWSRTEIYGFLEQNLTPNAQIEGGHPDRFDPTALFGVSIPFGRTEHAK